MYEKSIANLRKFGFNVEEGKTINLERWRYMAGTDVERAKDINHMFADKQVKAIICAMGGQVAIRTLRHLDFDLIRANPKIFSGMSDITVFHLAFLTRADLAGLHQMDAIFGFGADMNSEEAKYETDLFFKVTRKPEPLGLLPAFTHWEIWREGAAKGRLFGGNVPSVQALIGTPYLSKPTEDIIFFWEAMTQPLELLDQRLVQFREAGLFDRAKGMLIGKIRGEVNGTVKDMTNEAKEALLEITEEFDFPVIANMDFGHYTPNLPLPMGLKARMEADDSARVWIDESYVE
jgi:muramoyltetrapeptide carboxypeptidase